jgi:hypothetical protein
VPVEVGQRLEGAEASVIEPTLERATSAFVLFEVEHALEPRFPEEGFGLRQ